MKNLILLSLILTSNSINAQYSNTELKEICKVWGIIKYKTKSTQKIDLELISILEHKLGLEKFVSKRIRKEVKSIDEDTLLFKNSSLLSLESQKYLSSILSKRNPKNYSFLNKNKKGFFDELSELTYSNEDLSKEYKLLGIFRLWNYLNYFFLKPNSNKKIQNSLAKSIEYILNNDELNYEKALFNLYSNLNDNHSVCYQKISEDKRDYIDSKLFGVDLKSILPFKTHKIDGKFIVHEVLNDSLDLKINDAILKINNKPPEEFYSDYYTCFSFKEEEIIEIKLQSKNVVISNKEAILLSEFIAGNNEITGLKNYFHLNNFNKNNFNKAKDVIKKNENLVLDLRAYPIDYNINKLLQLLVSSEKKTLLYSFHKPSYTNIPKYRVSKNYNSKKGKYSGKITLIINQATQSWSEFIVLSLSMNKNVEIIGQYSSNAIGQVNYTLPLPGNFYFSTTTIFGIPATERYDLEKGIKPDIFLNDWEIEQYLKNKKSQ